MQYPKDAPFPVYCKSCWWSDSWDAKSFGREYDFSKPFFMQFLELRNLVPQPGVIHQGNIVNSEYTNRVTDMRNCYLIFGTTNAENSRYAVWINGSKECQDCYATIKSERCYECIDSTNCYNLAFSRECTNCRDSWLLHNCQNVSNSFGCVNLRNKQYCIFNEQYSKEEYEKKIAAMNLLSASAVNVIRSQFEEFKKKFIVPALTTRRSIDSTGNYLEDCKDVTNGFNLQNIEHCRHMFSTYSAKDSMDYCQWGAVAEKMYEAINTGIQVANVHFSHNCWENVTDCEYIMNCHGSKDLFGCIGVRKGQYMILNKQYTKEEYEILLPKIRAQLDQVPYVDVVGRAYKYGEFFPFDLSLHAYNETLAQEFYPITESQAKDRGLPWRQPEVRSYQVTLSHEKITDSAQVVGDDLLKEVIGCAHNGQCQHQCTTAFRMIPEELAMHRRTNLPLPRLCPNCRHYERIRVRNPFKLWPRQCQCAGTEAEGGVYKNTAPHSHHGGAHCQNQFETSYGPDPRYAEGSGEASRPEKVYCIECYQQEVA